MPLIQELLLSVAAPGAVRLTRNHIQQALNNGTNEDLYTLVGTFATRYGREQQKIEIALRSLIHLAYSDNHFNREEQNLVEIIRRGLGVSLWEFDRIEAQVLEDRRIHGYSRPRKDRASSRSYGHQQDKEWAESQRRGEKQKSHHHGTGNTAQGRPEAYSHLSNSHKAALEILQSKPGDTLASIKKKYRKLCKLYHPDLKNNLPEEERRKNTRKFQEIQEAFEYLTQNHLSK